MTRWKDWRPRLLVVDLDGSLLPFRKMRVRSSELKEAGLPGNCLLIIENETCQHHLPEAADFDEFKQATVCEPVVAGTIVPDGLTNAEPKLYCRLLGESRGRLEQEFLPLSKVQQRIVDWLNASRQPPN